MIKLFCQTSNPVKPRPHHNHTATPTMAASVDMKIQILRKSMSTFSSWLDGCDALVNELPGELEKADSAQIRDLVLKYKV